MIIASFIISFLLAFGSATVAESKSVKIEKVAFYNSKNSFYTLCYTGLVIAGSYLLTNMVLKETKSEDITRSPKDVFASENCEQIIKESLSKLILMIKEFQTNEKFVELGLSNKDILSEEDLDAVINDWGIKLNLEGTGYITTDDAQGFKYLISHQDFSQREAIEKNLDSKLKKFAEELRKHTADLPKTDKTSHIFYQSLNEIIQLYWKRMIMASKAQRKEAEKIAGLEKAEDA